MISSDSPLVLIVDDNPRNLQFLGSILVENEYDLAVSTSGIQVFEFLENKKPDIILLDIMMPEMDGYEVCKKLKTDPNTKDIPVIFLTAKSEMSDIIRGFEVGAVDYVTKPFNSAELLARTKTHIALKRAREEINTLRGIIPICAQCKKIRDDEGVWNRIELYIEKHSEALFSHGMCKECEQELYGDEDWYKNIKEEKV
jgi:CheY-like chemotaxis protein